jgi:hypothetical protein
MSIATKIAMMRVMTNNHAPVAQSTDTSVDFVSDDGDAGSIPAAAGRLCSSVLNYSPANKVRALKEEVRDEAECIEVEPPCNSAHP